METFKHVSYTWLLAQLFHPLLWMLAGPIIGGYMEGYLLIWILVAGFVLSVPAYLLCLVFFGQVAKMNDSCFVKLLVWCLVAVACIGMGFLFVCVVFWEIGSFVEMYWLLIPGSIAAVLAILCRYQQFIYFNNQ